MTQRSHSIPPGARRSLFVYNLFFPLVFLALLPGIALRMFRRGGCRENFGQRLGRYSPEVRRRFASGRWWWIHSISVGETLIALKFVQELHRRDPSLRCVITVTTSTGLALARDARTDWLEVLYNPIDSRAIVCQALDLIRPERLVLVEGEAWPNLLAACRTRGIPVALINARLSPRSERRFLRARFWIVPLFNLIDLVCVPDEADIGRWQRLGLSMARLQLTGSIKFDTAQAEAPRRTEEFHTLLRSIGVDKDRPILLAGSTWSPEERILGELFVTLRREFSRLFLVIVPRHIERTADILHELAPLNLRIRRRTMLPIDPPGVCDVLLVDTTGELREWYALATVVFVGKSLPGIAQIGGQNPAEPATLGKAIIAGPHMENFAAVVQHLREQRGLISVTDPASLLSELQNLLRNPTELETIGQHGLAALSIHRGATERTASLLITPAPPGR